MSAKNLNASHKSKKTALKFQFATHSYQKINHSFQKTVVFLLTLTIKKFDNRVTLIFFKYLTHSTNKLLEFFYDKVRITQFFKVKKARLERIKNHHLFFC